MTARTHSTISIIVAAMNEEKLLEGVVSDTLSHLKEWFEDFEVILVDDGSTDQTPKIMDRMAENHAKIRVIHNPKNVGLGNVYRQGVESAQFEYVMMLCGDGGLPPASLPAIFERVGAADIVVPYIVNLRDVKSRSRYLLSRTYTTLVNWAYGFRLHYYNGLAVHRLDLLRSIRLESRGFGFQAEVLVKLMRAGATCVEVGVLGGAGKPSRSALRLQNVVSVVKTLIALFVALSPEPKEPRSD